MLNTFLCEVFCTFVYYYHYLSHQHVCDVTILLLNLSHRSLSLSCTRTHTHTQTNTHSLGVWESLSVICIVFHFSSAVLVVVWKISCAQLFLRISRNVNKHLQEKDDKFHVNSICTLNSIQK